MPARRQYYKKKQQPGRIQIYGQAGKQLYKDVLYLKTLINSELNYFPLTSSNNIDSTGQVVSCCNIVQGDQNYQRDGVSVLPRFFNMNLHVNKKITAAGTIDHETVRVILFRYWGEATSAAPSVTVAEVLTSADPLSFLQEDNTGRKGDRERRIEVLKSKLFTLDSVADTSRTWKWAINMNGPQVKNKQHIKFRSSTTEDPISGGIYFLIVTDNSSGANKSAFNFKSRLYYYDN